MSVTVTYNSSELSPTPFVARTQRSVINGSFTHIVNDFTLNGFITGNLDNARQSLLDIFSGDFKTFSVSGGISYSDLSCIVRNVNIAPSRISGVTSYSVELECYDADSFADLGVTEPSNEWNYTEGEDGIITLAHKVSANGMNLTGATAFTNAKNFVYNLTGISSAPTGKFGKNVNSGTYVLVGVNQISNNAAGFFSIEETYKLATSGTTSQPYLQVQNCNIKSGLDQDYTIVEMSIEQQTSPVSGTDITGQLLSTGTLFNLATFYSAVPSLNPEPVYFNLDYNHPKVTYKIGYTDDDFVTYFDFNQSFSTDEVTQVATVNIDGAIKSKGNIYQRNSNVSGFYTTNVASNPEAYLYSRAYDFYTGMGGLYTLRGKPNSWTKKEDPYRGEILLSASFDDRDTIAGSVDSSYTVEAQLPLPIFLPRASVFETGLYRVFDAAINNRQVVQLTVNSASLSGTSTIINGVDTVVDALIAAYVGTTNQVLESEQRSIVTGEINSVSVGNTYSFEATPIINIQPATSNFSLV